MAKKGSRSRLYKILTVAADFLVDFDSYFRDPMRLGQATVWEGPRYQRKLNYLRRSNLVDNDYSLERSAKSVLSLINQPWDNQWRLVSYDFPEKEKSLRRKTRVQLKELGFKKWQRSVWLSPLPVDTFLKDLVKETGDSFSLFTGRMYADDPKEIVARLWSVSDWQKKAKKLIPEIEAEKPGARKRFWDLVLDHPKVPLELLPYDWPLEELVQTFASKFK